MTGKLTNGVWSAVTETTYKEAYEEGYKAGAAAEREKCVKIAISIAQEIDDTIGSDGTAAYMEKSIRARGEK